VENFWPLGANEVIIQASLYSFVLPNGLCIFWESFVLWIQFLSSLYSFFFFFLVDEIIKVQTTTNEHYILQWWILAAARILKGKYKLE